MHDRAKRASLAELIAAEYFLAQKYYVFMPWMGRGPVDLVALRASPFSILWLDVKTARKSNTKSKNNRMRTDLQKLLGVRLCVVDIDESSVTLVDHDRQFTPRTGPK